ncbi:MAG: RNA polymerase subunit sigma-54 [Fervidobacterium sp.]|nr:RNA polymerase subunit sigma-54 [Fervidobacterium sp.]
MSDSKRSKGNEIGPKIQQKLLLTTVEKTYLQVLETPIYLLAQRYGSKEYLTEFGEEYFTSMKDLHHELEMLLPFLNLTDEQEKIAEYIIYNIDSKGKIRITAQELSDEFGVAVEEAQNLINTIYEEFFQEINQFSSLEDEYIIPDVIMTPEYVEVKKIEVKDPVVSKALALREETLTRICELLRSANEYFLKGYRKYPQLLTMRYVARNIGLSISTVSRAVKNKYVSTPRGTLLLRQFFGRVISSEILKEEIKELLRLDPKLTDNQLAILLRSIGIDISRRTVNKYRNML